MSAGVEVCGGRGGVIEASVQHGNEEDRAGCQRQPDDQGGEHGDAWAEAETTSHELSDRLRRGDSRRRER